MTKRHQPLCAQAGNPGLGQAWICIAILVCIRVRQDFCTSIYI